MLLNSNYDEEIIKKLSNKYRLTNEQVKSILSFHAKVVKKLMSRGKLNEVDFINRIQFGRIGFFILKERVLRSRLSSKGNEVSYKDEFLKAVSYLDKFGWVYFKWSKEQGFIFANYISGKIDYLTTEGVYNGANATVLFAKKVNEDNVRHGLDVNRALTLSRVEFKKVAEYTIRGKLVKIHNNLYKAHIDSDISLLKLRKYLDKYSNNYNTTKLIGSLKQRLWFYIENDALESIVASVGYKEPKHLFYIDMCDKDGNVLIKRLGRPFEAAEFIEAITNRTNIKVSPILRVLNTGNKMYGYVWNISI